MSKSEMGLYFIYKNTIFKYIEYTGLGSKADWELYNNRTFYKSYFIVDEGEDTIMDQLVCPGEKINIFVDRGIFYDCVVTSIFDKRISFDYRYYCPADNFKMISQKLRSDRLAIMLEAN